MTTQLNEQQINELLAMEVMGWKKGNTSIKQSCDPVYDVWHDGEWNIKFGANWNPYNNISQAFMVERQMYANKSYRLTLWREGGLHFAAMFREEGWNFEIVRANTIPAAICLAAVQVIQEKK